MIGNTPNKNWIFIVSMVLFTIVGGIILANIEKGDAILYFSDRRTEWANFFFIWITKVGELPVYLFFGCFFLFYRFRFSVMVLLTGVFSLLISLGLKLYFGLPRPRLYFWNQVRLDEINFIEGVSVHTSNNSFPSGHTFSAFAIFCLLAFLIKNKSLQALFFLLALLVGISRVYLVQHFFMDIYAGGILGFLFSWGFYRLHLLRPINENQLIDKSIPLLWESKQSIDQA